MRTASPVFEGFKALTAIILREMLKKLSSNASVAQTQQLYIVHSGLPACPDWGKEIYGCYFTRRGAEEDFPPVG